MIFKRIFGLLLSLVLLLSACQPITPSNTASPAPAAASDAALPDLGTLQIAYVPILNFTPFFVAVEKGYFAEQGLAVELQNVRNIDEMLAPLSTGQIDVSAVTISTGFLNAVSQKLDFRIVAGTGDPTVPPAKAPFLAASKALVDSGAVKGVADLKGRKLAINLRGSILEYQLFKGLEQVGLTLDDVELVTIPGPEMLIAVQNGAVDGAVAGVLNIQRMVAEGVAVPLLSTTDVLDSNESGGVVFGQRLLDPANREVGIRFLVAYLQAVQYLNDGGWKDPEVIAMLTTYTGMEAAVIERSPFPVYATDGAVNEAGIMDIQSFQISSGYVEYTEAVPVAEMADLTMLSEALARIAQK